jgi:hypothetical protein
MPANSGRKRCTLYPLHLSSREGMERNKKGGSAEQPHRLSRFAGPLKSTDVGRLLHNDTQRQPSRVVRDFTPISEPRQRSTSSFACPDQRRTRALLAFLLASRVRRGARRRMGNAVMHRVDCRKRTAQIEDRRSASVQAQGSALLSLAQSQASNGFSHKYPENL